MKKKLALLLCLILTVAMTFAMVGCGEKDDDDDDKDSKKKQESVKKDEETIVGEWEAEVDMLDYLLEEMGDDATADYIDMDEFLITMYLELDDDGKYEVSFDEKQFEEQILELFEGMMTAMMEETAEEADMTVEEMLEEIGYADMDEMLEDALAEVDMDSMMEGFEAEKGTYELDDDKLIFDDGDTEWTIEFDGDTFEITDMDGEDAEMVDLLPIVFERQ